MKYMVISDIHGNINSLDKILEIYKFENCSKLLILGDLPSYNFDNNIDKIIYKLNLMKNDIIYVKGNCDNNLNGILFENEYIKEVLLNNKKIILTHGHLFDKQYLCKKNCDIILVGHTHVSSIDNINGKLFVNPGSISKSRKGENSFAIFDNNIISIRNLENIILTKFTIND